METAKRGGVIKATIPKIRVDINVIILFRALGCESDKEIMNMVLNDSTDTAMAEALRPSIE